MEEQELREMVKPVMQAMLLDITKNQPENPDTENIDDEKIMQSFCKAKARLSIPRAAVSAEAYGIFNKKENFKPRKIPKSEDQIQRIKARILQSFLFHNLDSGDLDIVIDAMEEKRFGKNETIIKQGETGDCLYFIEEGNIQCYKRFPGATEDKLVKEYFPGEAFGELALLYNSPRAATLVSKCNCILWLLDRETFNHIVKESAQKKRNKYENFLKSVGILSEVDSYEISQIADALRSATFRQNEFIIREGEMGDVFYIIEEGTAKATKTFEPGKSAVEVKTYKAGDYFGELALIKGEPRAANIIATSDVKVISVDRNSFKRLLGPLEEILKRNSDTYVKYMK